eukprot:3931888-Rhodomonas_salina.3
MGGAAARLEGDRGRGDLPERGGTLRVLHVDTRCLVLTHAAMLPGDRRRVHRHQPQEVPRGLPPVMLTAIPFVLEAVHGCIADRCVWIRRDFQSAWTCPRPQIPARSVVLSA